MFTLVVFILVFVGLVYVSKKQSKKRMAQIATDSKDASSMGMNMEANIHKVGRYETFTDENYSGTTGAIEWQLQSREIYDRQHRTGSSWRYTTQWTSPSVRFPKNKFLMIMSTPGRDNSKQQLQQKGFFSSLKNVLAEGALDMYVGGYFGVQYKKLINIDRATKIDIPELKEFFILTTDEQLSKKFLSDITVKYIVNWMTNKPHFTHNARVSMLGVLFAPDRSIVSCQALMTNANEAKVFSDFGAGLATLMKEMG